MSDEAICVAEAGLAQRRYLHAKRDRAAAIRDAIDAGAAIRAVARATGLDPSHVMRIARKAREEG